MEDRSMVAGGHGPHTFGRTWKRSNGDGKRVTEIGGVTREDQGWRFSARSEAPRQDRHRNDRGLAPESRTDLDREQIREGEGGTPKFPTCDIKLHCCDAQELIDESLPRCFSGNLK